MSVSIVSPENENFMLGNKNFLAMSIQEHWGGVFPIILPGNGSRLVMQQERLRLACRKSITCHCSGEPEMSLNIIAILYR